MQNAAKLASVVSLAIFGASCSPSSPRSDSPASPGLVEIHLVGPTREAPEYTATLTNVSGETICVVLPEAIAMSVGGVFTPSDQCEDPLRPAPPHSGRELRK